MHTTRSHPERDKAMSMPLEQIDPSKGYLFEHDYVGWCTLRERAARILDGLPIGEIFDWVPRVAIELSTQMLATLFDFPFEDRRLLTWWSDMATGDPDGNGPVTSWQQRLGELGKCQDNFTGLWNQRVNAEPRPDLISTAPGRASTSAPASASTAAWATGWPSCS